MPESPPSPGGRESERLSARRSPTERLNSLVKILKRLISEGEIKYAGKGDHQFYRDARALLTALGAVGFDDNSHDEVVSRIDELEDILSDRPSTERKTICEALFVRVLLDQILGPIVVVPNYPKNKKNPSPVELSWIHFPIAHGPDPEPRDRIGELLITKTSSNATPLLSREARILVGTGTTCFHVALAIARRLRRTVENDDDGAFDHGNFVEIHTDSFETARLLAPLARRPNAPRILLIGCEVSQTYYSGRVARSGWIDCTQKQKREIDVAVVGCALLTQAGEIYTNTDENGEDKQTVSGHIDEPKDKVFVVATSDKLAKDNDDPRMNASTRVQYKRRDRKVYLVTDKEPNFVPDGWSACWPEGEIPGWAGAFG